MASARKKQDEKNLKILRELVSLPGNKHCFDCNQRGPTYVNMTIGSFVCTKCSGMLRGLTPPHRVKSISMASFTTEEVDFVKSKGNDHCRQTWLALYDQNTNAETKDEQQIKDFMIDKYERKRYYHDKGLRNGTLSSSSSTSSAASLSSSQPALIQKITAPELKASFPSPPVNGTSQHLRNGFSLNGNHNNFNNNNNISEKTSINTNDFVADFSTANFVSTPQSQFNSNSNATGAAASQQPSFANFDNNVIFNSATSTYPITANIANVANVANQTYTSSYDLIMNQLTQYPQTQYVTNTNPTWYVAAAPTTNGSLKTNFQMNKVQLPPSEDRYAALKDLDNALKTQQLQHEQQQQHQQQQQQQHQQQQHQQQLEWSTGASSNGSGYTSPLYGSPSTTGGSMYGSPSQGNFMAAFPQHHDHSNMSNPFAPSSPRNPWSPTNGNTGTSPANTNNTVIANNCFSSYNNGIGQNPFRSDTNNHLNGTSKFNGLSNGNGFGNNGYQNMFGNSSQFVNKPTWAAPNPFSLGVSPGANGNSNNPFL